MGCCLLIPSLRNCQQAAVTETPSYTTDGDSEHQAQKTNLMAARLACHRPRPISQQLQPKSRSMTKPSTAGTQTWHLSSHEGNSFACFCPVGRSLASPQLGPAPRAARGEALNKPRRWSTYRPPTPAHWSRGIPWPGLGSFSPGTATPTLMHAPNTVC